MTDPTGAGVEPNVLDGVPGQDAPTSERSLQESDLALLRRYEPVVCYTKGELFLPTSVGPYVAQCSLWAGTPGKKATRLADRGDLTLERLCRDGVAHRDRRLFLRFVDEPLDRKAYKRWRRIPRERLTAAARFSTTGLFGRLLDAGMRASLLLRGTLPVVFAGAGSHSGAFISGDYVVSVNPASIRRVLGVLHGLRRFVAPWRKYSHVPAGLGIPFVDYARGDGVAIGPGRDRDWTPVVIDDETPWVRDYRGLWGLETGDRFGGERAPSGPRYERDGSVRRPWANPLGWAGLLKVPPEDHDVGRELHERITAIDRELSELDATIAAERTALRGVLAQVRSLRTQEYAQAVAVDRMAELSQREQALDGTIAARTSLAEERRLHLLTLAEPIAPEPPQAHVKNPHQPYVEAQERRTRFLNVWVAISTPLLMGSIIVSLLATPCAFLGTVVILFLVFSAI